MKTEHFVQNSENDAIGARIAAVARVRFQQFGYAKTSMQEIADEAGMSPANLYRFYDGKLAIGRAVAATEQAELFAACDQAVRAVRGGLAARLIALFQALIDAHQRKIKQTPLLFELGLIVTRDTPGARRQYLDEVETRIVTILAAGPKNTAHESTAAKARGRLILLASAPFVLPWMMLNKPFGDPRPDVVPLVKYLLAGMALEHPEG